jgi:hypothetical membrane protein
MSIMNIQKIGVAAGFVAPVWAFLFISLAILSFPSFSWTNNALSDLGVVPGLTSWLFTLGLCGGGVLAFVFAVIGLFQFVGKGLAGKVGAGFFAASTLTLVCIGIFNESFRPTHYMFSVAFFVLAPLAFFILTAGFYLKGRRGLAVFTNIVAMIAAIPWILQLTISYVANVAVPETISGAAVSVWVILLSTRMLQKSRV